MTISEFINKVGFQVNKKDVQSVNNTIQSIKSTATKALGLLGIGFSLSQLRQISEEFNGINDSINYTYQSLDNTKEAQNKILEAANATKTSYGTMAGIVTKLTQLNEDLFPIDDATTFATVVQQLMITSGKSEGEAAAAQNLLARAFQREIVDAGTLNQIQRQAPALYKEIANAIGVTTNQLDEMAKNGQLTAQQVKEAVISSKDAAQLAFNNLDFSISDAMTNIRNQWGFFVDDVNSTLGITQAIAKTMVSGFSRIMNVLKQVRDRVVMFADKLGGTTNLLKLLAIVAGALFLAFNFGKITSALKSVMSFLSSIKASTMLIVGVIILIALLVEDFINFMQGNDSLLGSLLEQAGIDTDEFRNDLISIWENIKTALTNIWEGIKKVAIPVFETLKSVFEAIWEKLTGMLPGVAEFVDNLANGEVDAETWQAVGEAIAVVVGIVLALVAAYNVFIAVQTVVSALIAVFTSPITLIVVAIAALIAIIVLCIKYWDKIKAVLITVWEVIKSAFINAWNFIKSVWETVVAFFQAVWDGIVNVFKTVVDFFAGIFTSAWNAIVFVWETLTGFFSDLWQSICDVFNNVVGWFAGVFSDAWEAIKNVFSTVSEFFTNLWNSIVKIFTTVGTTVGNAIAGAFKAVVNAVINFAQNTINSFIRAINGAISMINKIPGVSIGLIGELSLPRLAAGGYVEANKPRQVIVGDNKTEGEIVSPISKMRQTVLEALNMFMPHRGPFGGAAAMTSGGTSNRNITQNVEINNTFNGDKAIQKKAASAMDSSAKDATAELARGLAYAK